jgi:hypothetical protein
MGCVADLWAGGDLGDSGPPRPQLLMHQLRALEDSREFPRLDSQEFARQVRILLATAAPVTTAR